MNFQHIRLVTFDATNTLLKFRVAPWKYYTLVARDFGFAGTENDLKTSFLTSYYVMWNKYPNFGKSQINWRCWWRQVIYATFNDFLPGDTNVKILADKLIDDFSGQKCWCIAEGGNRIVNLFRARGVSIGVISNFDPRLKDILESLDFLNKFDFVLTSYEIGYSKPDKRIFDYALQLCENVRPFQSLHIGDNVDKDFKGARAAGWHALLVSDHVKSENPPATKYEFKNLNMLSDNIEENKKVF